MSESAVGAVLGENTFRLVQLGQSENGWKLENMAEANLPFKFRLLTLNDDSRFEEIREAFKKNVAKDGWVQKTGVAVDRNLLFIKETHVDTNLPSDEVEKQVFWEAQQFLPEDLSKSYKVFWVRISQENPFVLLVVFRKLLAERIEQLFKESEKTLQNISVDQFAAMAAVEKLFEPKGRLVGLADVKKETTIITLLKDGNYFRSKEIDFTDVEDNVLESDQNLSKEINREIDRLLLESEINESDSPISQLYIYGEKASLSLASALEGGPALEVRLANPFEKVEIPEALKDSVAAIENTASWLVGFGAALEILA